MKIGQKEFSLPSNQRIKRLKKGFPKGGYRSYGFDTEFLLSTGQTTILGLQGIDVDHLHVLSLSDNPLDVFLSWVVDLPHNSIIWAHNLEVDLVALLAGESHAYRQHWYTGKSTHLGIVGWSLDLSIRWGTPCFGEIYIGKHSGKRRFKKIIHLRDTFAFFKASLDRIGRDLFQCPKVVIDQRLYEIDYRRYDGAEKDQFLDYTRRDLHLVQRIGDWLVQFCRTQDIRLPVSLPHAAVSLFRRKLKEDLKPLDFRPTKLACQAYYGGRVQIFQKGLCEGVKKYDLNSAYTAAIRQLRSIEGYKVSTSLHPFGVYTADVLVRMSSLPVRLRNGSISFPTGRMVGKWVGLELQTACELGFVEVQKCVGYVPTMGDLLFTAFVDQWWKEKANTSKSSILYSYYKLIPNSLYGKTINLNQNDEGQYKPSSFFCPHWAAYITAYCRSQVMKAQAKLGDQLVSIQTDGLWTSGEMETSKSLGMFDLETSGDLVSVRGNAYIAYQGRQIDRSHTKLHGYMAPCDTFQDTIVDRGGEYTIRKWARRYHARLKGGYANTEYDFTFHWNHNVFDRKTWFPEITGRSLFEKSYVGKSVDLQQLNDYI